MEANDTSLLNAVPGASLASNPSPRAPVLAAEVARIDALVAREAARHMGLFDDPASFTTALKALA